MCHQNRHDNSYQHSTFKQHTWGKSKCEEMRSIIVFWVPDLAFWVSCGFKDNGFPGRERISHHVAKGLQTLKPGLTDKVVNVFIYQQWSMDYVIFLIIKYCFIGTWIIADTDIPPIESLIIWGVLELEDKHGVGAAESSYRKVVLNATYVLLQVRGKFLQFIPF